jgi:hypothetical protein
MQDWESSLQTLHKLFAEVSGDSCLLWVNPAQGDPFEDDALVQERRVRVPISHPRMDLRFAPYLVPLTLDSYEDADIFKRSVQLAWQSWSLDSLNFANGQPIAGWAVTSRPVQQLARHWATHCHLHQHGGLTQLLRFHDPGVREWLWPTLRPAQRRQLLGPATTLIGFDRQQALMFHEMDGGELSADGDGHLTLDGLQWAQVEDYAALHAAWLQWCQRAAPGSAEKLPVLQEQRIFSALSHASRYGIHDPQDRTLFALHALELGPDFHADQRLQAVWKLTATGEFYGGALEDVTKHAADQLHRYLTQS